MQSWTIRAYRPGDEYKLVALFERVFQRSISEDHWCWKFKQLPSPVENVWLAVSDEQPIAQYGGIPICYHLPKGNKTALVIADAMTAPEFRRQGIFTKIGQLSHDAWAKAGIPFIIGTPNQQLGSTIITLGWEPLFPLKWLVRPLRLEVVLARRFKAPPLSRFTPIGALWNKVWEQRYGPLDEAIQIRQVKQAGPEFDTLWEKCSADAPISIIRDGAWVNWRYLKAPLVDYQVWVAERDSQPVGYVVYRWQTAALGKKLGFIAELLTVRNDVAARQSLIWHAISHLKAGGADTAVTLAIPNTEIYRAFRQTGFLFSWGAFTVRLIPFDPNLDMNVLRNAYNWILSGGDFDAI